MSERPLVPVVAQDVRTGRILMLAWADLEALEATRRTGEAHFWSRSRNELWRKGATSGNTMAVLKVRTDCDTDAIVYEVVAAGPACHTGKESCFSESDDAPAEGFAALESLWATITSRARERPPGSYTTT
ncbi:phosphoribosyl-AMP cyclohydrolase, partial [bacterium]|nr:phosphoribosyl-AMP cyclohydrolase [bacterium]